MKALSIWQPWAWLIVNGLKDIENRPWSTTHRGEFLVHAAKTYDEGAHIFLRGLGIIVPRKELLERGGIVGQASIVDCVAHSESRWFVGPYGFVLQHAQPLPFRPYRGQLSFFEVRL
jgi:hypothetical protein